jgi:hypothetical protein
MKIVYENNWFARLVLAKGFSGFMFFGLVLGVGKVPERMERHEMIHVHQWLEVTLAWCFIALWIGLLCGAWWTGALAPVVYYVLYVVNWLVALVVPGVKDAYRAISFEREAYANETDMLYLDERVLFGWVRYMFKQ